MTFLVAPMAKMVSNKNLRTLCFVTLCDQLRYKLKKLTLSQPALNFYSQIINHVINVEDMRHPDQKKTSCYDIDVEVDDTLKTQMNSFLLSTASQQVRVLLFVSVGSLTFERSSTSYSQFQSEYFQNVKHLNATCYRVGRSILMHIFIHAAHMHQNLD